MLPDSKTFSHPIGFWLLQRCPRGHENLFNDLGIKVLTSRKYPLENSDLCEGDREYPYQISDAEIMPFK
jgi:hypothetical protein